MGKNKRGAGGAASSAHGSGDKAEAAPANKRAKRDKPSQGAQPAKPAPAAGSSKGIDDIFSALKNKPAAPTPPAEQRGEGDQRSEARVRPSAPPRGDDEFFDSRGARSKRKLTEEGYPIYTEEELGIREGGGDTDQCPFDCDCCY